MIRLLFSVFLVVNFILLSVFVSVPVYAQENEGTVSAKLARGGSYELFWPLTAGKTSDDSLYFLKIWKEDLSGLFIFNAVKKADYEVTLSTKRVLEAEKLLKDGKVDQAVKTLEKASNQLTLARGKFSKVVRSGSDFQTVKVNLRNQLSNLDAFTPKLAEFGVGESQSRIDQIEVTVKKFLGDLE